MSDRHFARKEFVAILSGLGMGQQQFAKRCKLAPETVYHWGMGRNPFPAWVPLLLEAWKENKALRQAVMHLAAGPRGPG